MTSNTIWWAHTQYLVKTDRSGRIVRKAEVGGRHAGCEVKDGRLYSAVCAFNGEPRKKTTPDCHVMVGEYDAETLVRIDMHVLDINDRAGSFCFLEDGTFLVGCLRHPSLKPTEVKFHHIGGDYRLIKTHVVDLGKPVKLGIEVIRRFGDDIYLFIYDGPVMKLDAKTFAVTGRYRSEGGQMGFAREGDFVWTGQSRKDGASGQYKSKLIRKPLVWKPFAAPQEHAADEAVGPLPSWGAEKIAAAERVFRQWKGADETVVIPVTSDLHDWCPDFVRPVDWKSHKSHILFAREAGQRFGADAYVDLGDIGLDLVRRVGPDGKGRTEPSTEEEHKRRIATEASLYADLNVPSFHCVGNHDLGNYKVFRFKNAAYFGRALNAPNRDRGFDVKMGPDCDYGYWDVPGKKTRLLFLNSFDLGHAYGFRDEQVAFVAKALDVPEGWTVAAFTHWCLYQEIGYWVSDKPFAAKQVKNLEKVVALFEGFVRSGKGRLAGIFCGDSHFNNYAERNGVPYYLIQSYGWAITKRGEVAPGGHHRHFLRKNDINIDVVAIKPATGETKLFTCGVTGL